MNNKIRLVMVEQNGSGGLIHYAYQLCTALANADLDVTLVTGKNYELADFPHNFRVENRLDLWPLFEPVSSEDLHENQIQKSWRKLRWTVRRGVRALLLVRAWVRLTRYLLELKPDLVQFSKINFPFESLFLAYMQKRHLVLTQICHEFELRESTGPFAPLILKLYADIYTHFSIMFFHAQENRDRFLELFPFVPKDQTHIIPHGNSDWLLKINSDKVDVLEKKYGLQKDERVILFFGLLSPSKGLDDLVEAFALTRQSCRAKLIIAGYPTKYIDMDELYSRISRLGLKDDVIIDARYIPLEQIRPLMELATVVVYPYLSSTQSGALQIAYTFGKPIIATRVGGLPEAVDDTKNGFLVQAHSPQELAEKITLFVTDPQLAKEMGNNARHLSETRFEWGNVAKQIRLVYDQSINSRAVIKKDDSG